MARRIGSPACGDVWQDHADGSIQVNGYSAQYPNLVSSYDPGATHNPPVPDPPTCSAQPKMEVDSNWYNGTADPNYQTCVACVTSHLVQPVNFNAFVGLYYWATSRDYTNTSSCTFTCYSLSDSQYQMAGFGGYGDILWEDNSFSYFIGSGVGSGTSWNFSTNTYFRRNKIINNYINSITVENQSLAASPTSGGPTNGLVLFENLIDGDYCYQGFSCVGWTFNQVPGFSHLIYKSLLII